jgi:hypothetical protein
MSSPFEQAWALLKVDVYGHQERHETDEALRGRPQGSDDASRQEVDSKIYAGYQGGKSPQDRWRDPIPAGRRSEEHLQSVQANKLRAGVPIDDSFRQLQNWESGAEVDRFSGTMPTGALKRLQDPALVNQLYGANVAEAQNQQALAEWNPQQNA